MSECQEVAASIWRARSITDGNGLNTVAPIRRFDDAVRIARHHLGDESPQIIDNVADSLFAKAIAAGTVRP